LKTIPGEKMTLKQTPKATSGFPQKNNLHTFLFY
jgi:hypothetical protein